VDNFFITRLLCGYALELYGTYPTIPPRYNYPFQNEYVPLNLGFMMQFISSA